MKAAPVWYGGRKIPDNDLHVGMIVEFDRDSGRPSAKVIAILSLEESRTAWAQSQTMRYGLILEDGYWKCLSRERRNERKKKS